MYCKDCKFSPPTGARREKYLCKIWNTVIDPINGSCADLQLKKQFESYSISYREAIVRECGIERDDFSPLLNLDFIKPRGCRGSEYCNYRDSIENNEPAPFTRSYICMKIGDCDKKTKLSSIISHKFARLPDES